MSGPTSNNHDLVSAVAEVNRAAAAAALPASTTPVLTTVGDATAPSSSAPPPPPSAATTTTMAAAAAGVAGEKVAERGRGAFVVLEGLDRSGKTTQVELLRARLAAAGREVAMLRFPDRTTPTGQIINQYLSSSAAALPDQSIHLLFTANRWEAAPRIGALLAAGTTVVCDRYYYSGMVYSAAKGNPGLTLPWARAPEVGLPRPDAVVFLDLDGAAAARRGGFGEERYETGEMQAAVRGLFWGLKAGVVPVAGGEVRLAEESEDLVVVDAGAAVDEVAEEIWRVVAPRVEGVERGEFGAEVRRVS